MASTLSVERIRETSIPIPFFCIDCDKEVPVVTCPLCGKMVCMKCIIDH